MKGRVVKLQLHCTKTLCGTPCEYLSGGGTYCYLFSVTLQKKGLRSKRCWSCKEVDVGSWSGGKR